MADFSDVEGTLYNIAEAIRDMTDKNPFVTAITSTINPQDFATKVNPSVFDMPNNQKWYHTTIPSAADSYLTLSGFGADTGYIIFKQSIIDGEASSRYCNHDSLGSGLTSYRIDLGEVTENEGITGPSHSIQYLYFHQSSGLAGKTIKVNRSRGPLTLARTLDSIPSGTSTGLLIMIIIDTPDVYVKSIRMPANPNFLWD